MLYPYKEQHFKYIDLIKNIIFLEGGKSSHPLMSGKVCGTYILCLQGLSSDTSANKSKTCAKLTSNLKLPSAPTLNRPDCWLKRHFVPQWHSILKEHTHTLISA